MSFWRVRSTPGKVSDPIQDTVALFDFIALREHFRNVRTVQGIDVLKIRYLLSKTQPCFMQFDITYSSLKPQFEGPLGMADNG